MLTTRIAGSDSLSAISLAEDLIAFLNESDSDIFEKDDSLQALSGVKAFASRIDALPFRGSFPKGHRGLRDCLINRMCVVSPQMACRKAGKQKCRSSGRLGLFFIQGIDGCERSPKAIDRIGI